MCTLWYLPHDSFLLFVLIQTSSKIFSLSSGLQISRERRSLRISPTHQEMETITTKQRYVHGPAEGEAFVGLREGWVMGIYLELWASVFQTGADTRLTQDT